MYSDETKLKKSLAMKGRILTNEYKSNISKARKGVEPWNKGLKLPEQTGEKNSFYGKSHSEETKSILSENIRNIGQLCLKKENVRLLKKEVELKLRGTNKGMNNPSAKIYKVVSPKGIKIICKGSLKEFCKNNNLDSSTRYDVAKGIKPKTTRSKHYG